MIELKCPKCNKVITNISDEEIDIIISRWEYNLKGYKGKDFKEMFEYFLKDLLEIHQEKDCKVHYLNISRR